MTADALVPLKAGAAGFCLPPEWREVVFFFVLSGNIIILVAFVQSQPGNDDD